MLISTNKCGLWVIGAVMYETTTLVGIVANGDWGGYKVELGNLIRLCWWNETNIIKHTSLNNALDTDLISQIVKNTRSDHGIS